MLNIVSTLIFNPFHKKKSMPGNHFLVLRHLILVKFLEFLLNGTITVTLRSNNFSQKWIFSDNPMESSFRIQNKVDAKEYFDFPLTFRQQVVSSHLRLFSISFVIRFSSLFKQVEKGKAFRSSTTILYTSFLDISSFA